ncbi:MAG: DPP IV N-terminal domain-containing protein, partial [Tepidisphaeraceae bacterium]
MSFRGILQLTGVGLVLCAGALAIVPGIASGRADEPPRVMYPEFLEQYAATYRFNLGKPATIKLSPDGKTVLFLRSGPRTFVHTLYEYDVEKGEEKMVLTSEQVLGDKEETLTPEEQARRERQRSTARGIATFNMSEDGERIVVPLGGRLFGIHRPTRMKKELALNPVPAIDPQFSPDGKKWACVRAGDLHVTELQSGREQRITRRPAPNISNGLAEFVAQEEMDRSSGYWWSPDSNSIAYEQVDVAGVEFFSISDPTHAERPATTWPYPRPGKKNASVKLGIIPAKGGETVWVQWDREKYPYLATVRWKKNSPLTILVQNRTQTEELLLAVEPTSGATTNLLTETDAAWLNIEQACPLWLDDGSGFLWMTERGGAWQLELHARDGKLLHTLTQPDFGLRTLLDADPRAGVAWVIASDDPTQAHLWRVPLDPSKGPPVKLTEAPGVHAAVFSKDHST